MSEILNQNSTVDWFMIYPSIDYQSFIYHCQKLFWRMRCQKWTDNNNILLDPRIYYRRLQDFSIYCWYSPLHLDQNIFHLAITLLGGTSNPFLAFVHASLSLPRRRFHFPHLRLWFASVFIFLPSGRIFSVVLIRSNFDRHKAREKYGKNNDSMLKCYKHFPHHSVLKYTLGKIMSSTRSL